MVDLVSLAASQFRFWPFVVFSGGIGFEVREAVVEILCGSIMFLFFWIGLGLVCTRVQERQEMASRSCNGGIGRTIFSRNVGFGAWRSKTEGAAWELETR
ncbi:hypothetical protein EJ03DRAFT_177855 [Teratosphaeria nubilosa]|uniref:Uncharacterized protein n=1 Tax=Teratosphaeria nubilosa TaxID=161662 RepID=A0A6G1L1J0_9PEZI|nr:hypothetical protein EJ03DRAFT_177855 [Teratosphaeria nubilosa]